MAVGIAKRDKARLLPTGAYAQNALGLSTQVPLKIVYLTDGSPRMIKIGERTIQFKKTTPKNLALKGKSINWWFRHLKISVKTKILSGN